MARSATPPAPSTSRPSSANSAPPGNDGGQTRPHPPTLPHGGRGGEDRRLSFSPSPPGGGGWGVGAAPGPSRPCVPRLLHSLGLEAARAQPAAGGTLRQAQGD